MDQTRLGSAPATHPLTELDLTLMDVENGFDAQQVSKAGDKLIDTTAAAQIVEIIDDGQQVGALSKVVQQVEDLD